VASICLTLQKQYKLRLNINQTPFQNAVSNIVNTPASKYFSTSKLAFHDLTDQKIVPPLAKSVLGLGFKFICTPPYTTGDISPNTARFERDFQRKVFFATPTTPDTPNKHHKLYVKSLWSPPLSDIPTWVDARLSRFFAKLRTLFEHRKAQPNLLPFQRAALRNLRNDTNLVFPDTDKGLGPCAVTYDQYIRDALVHLKDPTVFKQLSKEEAWAKAQLIENNIRSWLTSHKKAIDKDAANYIEDHLRRNRHAPFGKFYTTYKIHKQRTPTGFPTRPVCSDVTSLPHGLGKWVDTQLQPVAKAQPSYFQDSYSLKKLLSNTDIPPNALLFTADAKSMYTNIRTGPALAHISHLLRQEDGRTFHHYDTQALIEAVELVFTNNILQFGDTYWQQVSGTGMGIAPAPPWATIYYALHENRIIPRWTSNVLLYRRFIDDIIGVWVCDTCPERNNILWAQFKADMQQWHGLEWEFSGLSRSCNYMDLTLTITGRTIQSTLFEKAQNLYLYLPPHSSHPRGPLQSLIFGNILRIHRLCSTPNEIQKHSRAFLRRLINRGHNSSTITPIFYKATQNARAYMQRTPDDHAHRQHALQTKNDTTIFFHLKYHPQDPTARDIQQAWQTTIALPPNDIPLTQLTNTDGINVPIQSLTIAYSRPLNLRNQFSVRNIENRGRAVSSYLN
jgi:hypothetical protein